VQVMESMTKTGHICMHFFSPARHTLVRLSFSLDLILLLLFHSPPPFFPFRTQLKVEFVSSNLTYLEDPSKNDGWVRFRDDFSLEDSQKKVDAALDEFPEIAETFDALGTFLNSS
jgi:hypothetical protein